MPSSELTKRARAFGYAFRGIATLVRSEFHARIHALATICVVGLGFALEIDRMEWLVLALTIGSVWSFEAVNTAVESICDLVSPDDHPLVERAKDVAAGAVLISALVSVVVAILIFGPRLTD